MNCVQTIECIGRGKCVCSLVIFSNEIFVGIKFQNRSIGKCGCRRVKKKHQRNPLWAVQCLSIECT